MGPFLRSLNHPELGIGKLRRRTGNTVEIEYFDSPIADRSCVTVPFGQVRRVRLAPQTRVYFFDAKMESWRIGRIVQHVEERCFIRLPNKEDVALDESQVYTRWRKPSADPCDYLASRTTETPFFHGRRTRLLANLVRQRAACGGMTALISSPISLEPHQVEVVRRVLQDPVPRYLLADEVGLGKTIEAGVVIRQFVLDHPDAHRVLIVMPMALKAQWISELANRCTVGERFGHRIRFVALEELAEAPEKDLEAELVVVDEAHQAVRGWNESGSRGVFDILRQITSPDVAPRLLLLSATPVRRNEEGFLALLHLLDPSVYRLEAKTEFRQKVEKRQDLANLFVTFTEDQLNFFIEGMAEDLAQLFPNDRRLCRLLEALRPWVDEAVALDEPERVACIRNVRAHLSETYRLHRRLLRSRRSSFIDEVLPGRGEVKHHSYWDNSQRRAEQVLEQWRATVAAALWNRENSEDGRLLKRCFHVLLDSCLCDLTALRFCAQVRLGEMPTRPPNCGRLTSNERLRALTGAPLQADEASVLRQLAACGDPEEKPYQARVSAIVAAASEKMETGYRAVVFCTSPALADAAYRALKLRQGECVFRHSIEDDNWCAFLQPSGVGVIVCDYRAEEGLNLQGGKASIIHADLPLSPNSVEQRMGRLDRFGVGRPVASVVLAPEECEYWMQWASCLSVAWRVFSRSIASLQYVVEDEMLRLDETLLFEGAHAICAAAERLGGEAGLERELKEIRAQDELDSVDVLDESDRPSVTEAIEGWEEDEDGWREAMDGWMVDALSFVRVREGEQDGRVVRYHHAAPDRDRPTLLPINEMVDWFDASVEKGYFTRTFRPPLTWPVAFGRETARNRNTGLARIGHPLVDCLHRYLHWDDRGVSFASWCVSESRAANALEVYFRFDFLLEARMGGTCRLAGDRESTSDTALQRRADAALPPRMHTVWIGDDLGPVGDDVLDELENHSDRGTNVNFRRWERIKTIYNLARWAEKCRSAHECARETALRDLEVTSLSRNCAQRVREETDVVAEQFRSRLEALQSASDEAVHLSGELERELVFRKRLLAAVEAPSLRLDAAGVVFLAGSPLPED